MAFYPSVNQNYASTSFGPTWGYGDVPVVMQSLIDDLPDADLPQTYQVGTLLAKGSDAAHFVIYDATNQSTHPFKAVFFDESAVAVDQITGVQPGFVNCAINMRPSTLFLYSVLNGAQGGTTDIDYLVTNGYADIVNQYENGVLIKLVQFKGMGTGA